MRHECILKLQPKYWRRHHQGLISLAKFSACCIFEYASAASINRGKTHSTWNIHRDNLATKATVVVRATTEFPINICVERREPWGSFSRRGLFRARREGKWRSWRIIISRRRPTEWNYSHENNVFPPPRNHGVLAWLILSPTTLLIMCMISGKIFCHRTERRTSPSPFFFVRVESGMAILVLHFAVEDQQQKQAPLDWKIRGLAAEVKEECHWKRQVFHGFVVKDEKNADLRACNGASSRKCENVSGWVEWGTRLEKEALENLV